MNKNMRQKEDFRRKEKVGSILVEFNIDRLRTHLNKISDCNGIPKVVLKSVCTFINVQKLLGRVNCL